MSAKWRRNRNNPGRFDFYGKHTNLRNKHINYISRRASYRSKSMAYPYKRWLSKINEGTDLKEPEPLVDILESKDEVVVVAELAGLRSESLRINVRNQRLILRAKASSGKYYKSLNLPKRVIPDTIHTTCKNGVLEVRLRKVAEEKTIDKVAD